MFIKTVDGWRRIRIKQPVVPAPHDKTLMEQMGKRQRMPGEVAKEYCDRSDKYLADMRAMREAQGMSID